VVTDIQVRNLIVPGKHRIEKGLHLQVHQARSGQISRSWLVRYSAAGGKERWQGLGAYPETTLAKARAKAAEIRELARLGRDPLAETRQARAEAARSVKVSLVTFKDAALAFIAAHEPEWRNEKHRAQWRSTLAKYAFPLIGAKPVAEVDVQAVTSILDPIWSGKPETASRLRGRIENILDWATVRGMRTGDNPARWRGHLQMAYPSKNKIRTIRHHSAVKLGEAPSLWRALKERTGSGADALRFLILTACRSGEVRLATWSEIDFATQVWTVPAERMKAGRSHRVPLTQEAIDILVQRRDDFGAPEQGFVFPSDLIKGAALSDMTLSAVLRRLGRNDLTVHGFRSTFRDWAAELTDHSRELAEAALAHVVGDATERAYRRGDVLDKRRRLMEDWAAFLTAGEGE
jgi:integrase